MTRFPIVAIAAAATLCAAPPASAEIQGQSQVVERSKSLTPAPP